MTGRLRACDAYQRTALGDGWEVGTSVTAGACSGDSGVRWLPASVPGTVAGSLRDSGQWSFDSTPRQFDAEEWWYRVRFAAEPAAQGERVTLGLDGLATFAQVRLNGTTLVESDNMFVEHRCDVSALLQSENELVIRFSPLDAFLNVRRRRPRWRTPMVQHQQLRWVRTSLLGRTPGWTPPAAPVGPWRPVWLERRRWVDIGEHRLQANVVGDSGRLTLACALSPFEGVTLKSARLIAQRQDQGRGRGIESKLHLQAHPSRAQGELTLPDVELWWPHTHGEPALYHVTLILDTEDSAGQEQRIEADLGSVGFRTLRLDRESGRFALIVNGSKRVLPWRRVDASGLRQLASYRHRLSRCH